MTRGALATVAFLLVGQSISAQPLGAAADARKAGDVGSASRRRPPRVLMFIVADADLRVQVDTLRVATRSALEQHVFARVLSTEEAFVRGAERLDAALRECFGIESCYVSLAGALDVELLVVVSVRGLGDEMLLGARVIEVATARSMGSAIGEVPRGRAVAEVIPERLAAAFPRDLWDPFGELSVSSSPSGAEVSLDGRVVGVTPTPPLGLLLPGAYTVRVEKADHASREVLVEVTRGQRAELAVELSPIQSGLPWWVWVVGGVLATAGTSLAVYVATKGPEKPRTVCIGLEDCTF